MVKNLITSVIAAFIVSVLVVASSLSTQPVKTAAPSLGSTLETIRVSMAAGLDVFPGKLDGGLVFKNAISTTTTAVAESIPSSNFVAFSTILLNSGTPGLTLQLPASTTFPSSFLPKAGDRTDVMFLNSTSTTGNLSLVGFAPGTGTLISTASTTPANTASTTGGLAARISIMRKPNTDLLFSIQPFK